MTTKSIPDEKTIFQLSNDIYERQDFYAKLFGHSDLVRYDEYSSKKMLKIKIGLLYTNMKHFNTVIENLWQQRKYAGYSYLLMSPIVVHMVQDFDDSQGIPSDKLESSNFIELMVFRVLKCSSPLQTYCCAIFVDHLGRVYSDWTDFLENNRCGKGLLVFPMNGVYREGSNGRTLLRSRMQSRTFMEYMDMAGTGLSLLSVGAIGVACIPAVAGLAATGAVVAAASGTGLACTAYAGGRSVQQLCDRSQHDQTLSLKDQEARGAWLNIAMTAVSGIAASARKVTQLGRTHPKMIAAAERNPNLFRTAEYIADFSHYATFGASGVNCVNAIISIYVGWKENHTISVADLRNLSVSLFVFTNSVHNATLAGQIVFEITGGGRFAIEGLAPPGSVQMGSFIISAITTRDFWSYGASKLFNDVLPYVVKYVRESRNYANLELLLIDIAEQLTLELFKSFMSFVDNFIGKFSNEILQIIGPRFIEDLVRVTFDVIEGDATNRKLTTREYISGWLTRNIPVIENQIKVFFAQRRQHSTEVKITFEYLDVVLDELKQLQDYALYDQKNIIEVIMFMRKTLTIDATQILIASIKKFIRSYALDIQACLNRAIPAHVFINDFYNELKRIVGRQDFDQYLININSKQYSVIYEPMLQFYVGKIIGTDVKTCKKCNGEYHTSLIEAKK